MKEMEDLEEKGRLERGGVSDGWSSKRRSLCEVLENGNV